MIVPGQHHPPCVRGAAAARHRRGQPFGNNRIQAFPEALTAADPARRIPAPLPEDGALPSEAG